MDEKIEWMGLKGCSFCSLTKNHPFGTAGTWVKIEDIGTNSAGVTVVKIFDTHSCMSCVIPLSDV